MLYGLYYVPNNWNYIILRRHSLCCISYSPFFFSKIDYRVSAEGQHFLTPLLTPLLFLFGLPAFFFLTASFLVSGSIKNSGLEYNCFCCISFSRCLSASISFCSEGFPGNVFLLVCAIITEKVKKQRCIKQNSFFIYFFCKTRMIA